jgi:Caspase domain
VARHALLIGVSKFADTRLARLNAPENDVIALRGILRDSSRGGFDSVELSLNEDFLAVRDHLSRLFHDRAPDDLLLLYYSGHGILGHGNRLYLATAGSNLDRPGDRSVSSREVRDYLDESRAERKVVVLDCCHSGAFAQGAKTAGSVPAVTTETFSSADAELYVLTATNALEFAWDGADLRTGDLATDGLSRFTSWMIEGLESGDAAPDDEQITMDALHRYLSRRARSEGATAIPQRLVSGGAGGVAISANPIAGSSHVDPETIAALAAENWRTRLGAVTELAQQMHEGGIISARAARLTLRRHLQQPEPQREHDYRVRDAINKALEEEEKRRAEAEEEQRRAEAVRQAEEEQRAEAARLADEEHRRADAARPVEEEKRGPQVATEEKLRAERARQAQILSIIGVAPALLALLLHLSGIILFVIVILLASLTFFAIRSERRRGTEMLAWINALLAILVLFGAIEAGFFALYAVTFGIESAAAFLSVRGHRFAGWKQPSVKV